MLNRSALALSALAIFGAAFIDHQAEARQAKDNWHQCTTDAECWRMATKACYEYSDREACIAIKQDDAPKAKRR